MAPLRSGGQRTAPDFPTDQYFDTVRVMILADSDIPEDGVKELDRLYRIFKDLGFSVVKNHLPPDDPSLDDPSQGWGESAPPPNSGEEQGNDEHDGNSDPDLQEQEGHGGNPGPDPQLENIPEDIFPDQTYLQKIWYLSEEMDDPLVIVLYHGRGTHTARAYIA